MKLEKIVEWPQSFSDILNIFLKKSMRGHSGHENINQNLLLFAGIAKANIKSHL